MYEAILFDLDGTLLGLNNDAFVRLYYKYLAPKIAPLFGKNDFIEPINTAIDAMYHADGSKPSLRQVFIDVFNAHSPVPFAEVEPIFMDFYQNEFHEVRMSSRRLPHSRAILDAAKRISPKIILATVPVFPLVAVQARLQWAGLEDFPFSLITSFENMRFCKPYPYYYIEIAERMGVPPRRCLMIGNDHIDDMAAGGAGMQTYLVTDEELNAGSGLYQPTYRGRQEELLRFLQELR